LWVEKKVARPDALRDMISASGRKKDVEESKTLAGRTEESERRLGSSGLLWRTLGFAGSPSRHLAEAGGVMTTNKTTMKAARTRLTMELRLLKGRKA